MYTQQVSPLKPNFGRASQQNKTSNLGPNPTYISPLKPSPRIAASTVHSLFENSANLGNSNVAQAKSRRSNPVQCPERQRHVIGHPQKNHFKDDIIGHNVEIFKVKYVFVEPNLLVPLENFWANGLIAKKIADVPGLGENVVHLQEDKILGKRNTSASQVIFS